MLREHTPYMLRNDGKLFTCAVQHPYVVSCYVEDNDVINTFVSHINQIEWFYNHTNYPDIKKNIWLPSAPCR